MVALIAFKKNYIDNVNLSERPEANNQESLQVRVWKVAKVIFISSILFWYVSQPFFVAGILFGAVFYKETWSFAKNIFTWWEMTGWIKRLAACLFGIVSFPFLAKFGTFLWAAYLASDEITQALGQKEKQQLPIRAEDGIAQRRL